MRVILKGAHMWEGPLLQRRCNEILESLGLPVRHHRGWRDSARLDIGAVREIALASDDAGDVVLMLYPGDSVVQAREFYESLDRDRLIALSQSGWALRPNLHFAFIQRNMYWPKAAIELSRYLAFWSEKVVLVQKWEREYFEDVFAALSRVRQLDEGDVGNLRAMFSDSSRNSLNLCPGVEALYRWKGDEATRLDAAGAFSPAVRGKLIEAFATWKQPLPFTSV